MMNVKKVFFVSIIIVIIIVIIVGAFFIANRFPFYFTTPKNISGEKEEKLLKLSDSLNESLNNIILSIKNGEMLSAEDNLESYAEQLDKFILEGNKSVNDIDEPSLVNLRKKEWENYNLFLKLKKEVEPYPQFKKQIKDIETTIENRLTQQFLEVTEKLIFSKPGQLYYRSSKLLAVIGDFYHQIISIRGERKGAIHKKVVCEAGGGSNSYEVWIDLERGDIRQEKQTSFGKEIDITDGKTQKKLALDVYNKLAEWINRGSGKVGIMSEGVDDPYTQFKNKLNTEKCWLYGADIIDGEQIYILKCPIYDKDYSLYYISARSYLPLREMYFQEKILSEPIVTKTGEMELILDCWFTVAEIINKESLPKDIFDQKIPDEYKIEDWVPLG